MPIPPEGWGGVEHLVWDMKLALNELNHDVQIIFPMLKLYIIRMSLASKIGKVRYSTTYSRRSCF